MIIQILSRLWETKKRTLGKKLQKGIPALAEALRPAGEEHGYSQIVHEDEIQWRGGNGQADVFFFYLPDPRDLPAVIRVFQRTKDSQCELSAVFVHQWADGEGNWDVFGIHPQYGMRHWNRFWGKRGLDDDPGPFLREDLSTLFQCGEEFPVVSRKKWGKILEISQQDTIDLMSKTAENFSCLQTRQDDMLEWRSSTRGRIEVMFAFFRNPPVLDDYLRIYRRIETGGCPITFLFQRVKPEMYDIFRFSARSYLEHHNQAK